MPKIFVKIGRLLDFILSSFIFGGFLLVLSLRRLFGKVKIEKPQNKILSLTKDGIFCIKRNNSPGYFDWDFTRPHTKWTYIFYIGDEVRFCGRVAKKAIGINIVMPLAKAKVFAPYSVRALQQIWGFWVTAMFICKTGSKVVEVMAPSKLTFRAMLIKFILPVKIVTQVRGNQDLIYYFTPFPIFWPFKMTGQPFEVFQVAWDKFITMLFYRSCDLVIGYNVNNMLSAISNGAHPSKAKLSRIKVELSMLDVAIRPREQISDMPVDGKIISVWSRLSPEKLILESIKAFEILLDSCNENIHLLIAGDGPEKDRIEQYLQSSKHKNKVHLLGKRDRDFIAEMAHYSTLVLVPYGGGSLVEAVMLDRPIIAFDIEWHNELIRDGETGWLADFPDYHHYAEKIQDALSDPDECRRRAIAAKELALKMFDIGTTDAKEARYLEPLLR
jgi:glycosyltransferase involved in cell wall biosynthesis